MKTIELGKTVVRIASDYTGGRIGRVIELDGIKPRARVSWEKESNGTLMKLRTWIRLSDLQLLANQPQPNKATAGPIAAVLAKFAQGNRANHQYARMFKETVDAAKAEHVALCAVADAAALVENSLIRGATNEIALRQHQIHEALAQLAAVRK